MLGQLYRQKRAQIPAIERDVVVAYLSTLWFDIKRQWKLHLLMAVSLVIVLLPIFMVIVMSTQSNREILDFTFMGIGSQGLDNYWEVLFDQNFMIYMRNSFIMALTIAIAKVILATTAAMAIVYYDFPFKRTIFLFILLTLMLPQSLLIVPLFELMVNLGWRDTFLALITPYLASATSILLLRQQYKSIPTSIVETSKLNGIGPIRFLVYVLIPMSKSMIVGLFVIMFIWSWNQYLWPLVAVASTDRQVVQVGLSELEGAMGAGEPLWGMIMAGTVLALIVPMVLMFVLYKPLLKTFALQMK